MVEIGVEQASCVLFRGVFRTGIDVDQLNRDEWAAYLLVNACPVRCQLQVWEGEVCRRRSDASIQHSHHSKSAMASSHAVMCSVAFDGGDGGGVGACQAGSVVIGFKVSQGSAE